MINHQIECFSLSARAIKQKVPFELKNKAKQLRNANNEQNKYG